MLYGTKGWGTLRKSIDFTFDELQVAFYELMNDLKKLGYKNKELKRENQILPEEKKDFKMKRMIC